MHSIESKNDSSNRPRFHRTGAAMLLIFGMVSAGAAAPATTPALPTDAAHPMAKAPQHHWYQIGRASWYGKFFQGKETASGEAYDMNQLTAAHRSLPLGSLVRVTNLNNHRSVVVRVNDRGPLPENRVIDLSYAAAHFLGLSHTGTAPVRLDLIRTNAQLAQLTYPLHNEE
jgi:rare lipoprotein A